ncbi:MAG: DUF2905 domain-containing protein [Parvularculaceae bacterium]|nr:DUF2905 domain-containing protein [Parvularculaceae bacterium]
MGNVQKILLLVGVAFIATALFWPFISKLPLGRLPGDVIIKRDNFSFYFPLTTMVLVSIVVTLIVRFFQK